MGKLVMAELNRTAPRRPRLTKLGDAKAFIADAQKTIPKPSKRSPARCIRREVLPAKPTESNERPPLMLLNHHSMESDSGCKGGDESPASDDDSVAILLDINIPDRSRTRKSPANKKRSKGRRKRMHAKLNAMKQNASASASASAA